MKKNSNELSEQQKLFIRKVIKDPVLFANRMLGVNLWRREAEILHSIQRRRRTAVKASHGVGKTFTLSVATLWWLARYRDGVVLTTSPTQRQVRTQLWTEIHRLVESATVPYPKLKSTELQFRDAGNFAIGFSTNQAENFQGFHGKHVLLIADEAPGIKSGIWDAIAGTMAGGLVHIVMAGNPTVPSGAFFDAFTRERELWNCFTISAFDSPNLEGLDLDELLKMDPSEGGPLDRNPYPHLVTRRWVYEQRQSWWHGSNGSSPNWLSRVMAQFPEQAVNALIKMSWLERARDRALASPAGDCHPASLVAGVDVGGGGEAETVVYVCENTQDRRRIIAMGAWRGEDTRGEVVNFLNQFRSQLSLVRVDCIGIGHGFAQHLSNCRFPVDPVNVALPCERRPNWRQDDPAARFINRRAQYYQALADGFERGLIEGLTDEATIGQLAGILYELDSYGRIKIESKADARSRGVRSPDRADALMLALGQPYQKAEIFLVHNDGTVRALHNRGSSAPMSLFPTGFVEVPYKEDDDRPRSRREQLDAVFGGRGRWRGSGF